MKYFDAKPNEGYHNEKTDFYSLFLVFANHFDILPLSKDEVAKLKKLSTFTKVKDLPYIKNLRGELDLTLNGKSIVCENTGYKLVRGRNIGYYKTETEDITEYVVNDFVYTGFCSDPNECLYLSDRANSKIYVLKPLDNHLDHVLVLV